VEVIMIAASLPQLVVLGYTPTRIIVSQAAVADS
jgi:hypothetical protein